MNVIIKYCVLLLLVCNVVMTAAGPAESFQQFPEYRRLINDFAGVLSPGVVQSMEQIAIELEQKTGAAVVVVTMETIDGEDETDYANRLFEAWGIGQKGVDKGVLILDVVDIRRIRIEIGYGLEGIIPDGLAGEIRDRYMVPYLSKNDFDNGLGQGFAAVISIIAKMQVSHLRACRHGRDCPAAINQEEAGYEA